MAHQPVGTNIARTTSGTSQKTAAIPQQTQYLRIVNTGSNGAFVKVGDGEPTATSADYFVSTNEPAILALGSVVSGPIAGATAGNPTKLFVPTGSATPFQKGQTVSLTVTGQDYWDFSHKEITGIKFGTNAEGLNTAEITVDTNTTGVATAITGGNADLRRSIKLAALQHSGASNLMIQQIQVTGA
tara:strand:+ start:892 stop:1449 length:558 start_codon:yes stop_codon:yes gene_type:complete